MKNKNILFIFIYILSLGLISYILGLIGYNTNYVAKKEEPIEYIKVPTAKNSLNALDEITNNDITYKEIPKSLIGSALTDTKDIITSNVKYCLKEDYYLPKGSLLYLDQFKVCDFALSSVTGNLLNIDISNIANFNNYKYENMYDYVDIAIKMPDNEGNILEDTLITNIPIIDILDANNYSIYKSSEPQKGINLLLDTSDEVYNLLNLAEYLRLELTPILKINSLNYKQTITNDNIKSLIMEKTLVLTED